MGFVRQTVKDSKTVRNMIIKQKLVMSAKQDTITAVFVLYVCQGIQTVFRMAVKVVYHVGKDLER